jgi:hypothetical protein
VAISDFSDAWMCVSKRNKQKELYRIETVRGPIEFRTYRMETRLHVLSQIIAGLGWKTQRPKD